MNTRLLFLSLGMVACGPLFSRPGDDFRVQVTTPEVSLVQRVGSYDLEFRVEGCDDFVADVVVAGGPQNRIEAKALGGGLFRASVPDSQLRAPDDYCLYDSERPQRSGAQLVVTCRQDARQAVENLRVTYASAWRTSYRGRGPVDAVFASGTPDRVFEVGSGWLDVIDGKEVREEVVAAVSPTSAPLLAVSTNTVHLWSGCPINDCGTFWFVDTPQEKRGVNASFIQTFDWSSGRAVFLRNVPVPSDALDLALDGEGSILLSRTSSTTALTRISGGNASVVALLNDEITDGKFGLLDNARVFLTHTTDNRTRLRRSDGTLVGEFETPGTGAEVYSSLAPTGDAWVTIRGGKAWLSKLARTGTELAVANTPLPTELSKFDHQTSENSSFGAAWTTSGVAIRDASGVDMFSNSSAPTRRWTSTIPAGNVRGAIGMGDSLVVLTSSGLRILDANGRLSGGADPVPPPCALDYYPRHAAIVGPDVVALAGKKSTYQFRAGVSTAKVEQ